MIVFGSLVIVFGIGIFFMTKHSGMGVLGLVAGVGLIICSFLFDSLGRDLKVNNLEGEYRVIKQGEEYCVEEKVNGSWTIGVDGFLTLSDAKDAKDSIIHVELIRLKQK